MRGLSRRRRYNTGCPVSGVRGWDGVSSPVSQPDESAISVLLEEEVLYDLSILAACTRVASFRLNADGSVSARY